MNEMEIDQIMEILPHKHPYLLIDRVTHREQMKRVVAIKATTYSEDLYRGHFIDKPILPGAVILEAASQTAGLLNDVGAGMIGYVGEVKKFRFKKQVKPGNLLEIEAVNIMSKGPFLMAGITVRVLDEVVAEGELQLFIDKLD